VDHNPLIDYATLTTVIVGFLWAAFTTQRNAVDALSIAKRALDKIENLTHAVTRLERLVERHSRYKGPEDE